jgi:hypothetical protein
MIALLPSLAFAFPARVCGTITYEIASNDVRAPLCAYTMVLPDQAVYPKSIRANSTAYYHFTPDQLRAPYYMTYTVSSPYQEPYCTFHFREDKNHRIIVEDRASDSNIRCEVKKVKEQYNLYVKFLPPFTPYFPYWGCA